MNKINRRWYLPAVLVLLLGSVFVIRRHAEQNVYATSYGCVFGTTYKITFRGDSLLMRDCREAMMQVDAALSMFNPGSNLSQINENRTALMVPMTREVLALAAEVSRLTGGAFDVTVAPLVNAWGFGFKHGALPDSTVVDSLLLHVGFDKVAIQDSILQKADTCVVMDCSAIAKGYACDVVARVLAEHGIEDYMVEIGGEVVTAGLNPKGKSWKVGVSRPTEDAEGQDVMTVLALSNRAMATSGNYRNFYVSDDGRKISHTIDPQSGYPVRHSLLSATVFAPTCARADAFATAFMVMGKDKAIEVLGANSELSAYLIYEENGELKTWASPMLEEAILKSK